MESLAPLPVAIPLLGAGLLAAGTFILPRRLVDGLAVAAAGATSLVGMVLLSHAVNGTAIHWFGGWRPREGVVLGISFVSDSAAAGAVTLAGVLTVAALVFSWRAFHAIGSLYHVLMLVILGGMAGFVLSGDLFNMFVFFELMGVAAYALTGYRIEAPGPIQGALNFAITNTVAGFIILIGVTLLYGRTGALNIAQVSRALGSSPADGLVVAAFVLLVGGFLVKAAVVPFHFWLADAYTVAPTPVLVLFSGITLPLGLYAVARLWATVFPAVGSGGVAAAGLLWAAGLTAVVGGVMSMAQRHLKRLLAFSTVAHGGAVLTGIALRSTEGLAGAGLFVLAHGLVEGSLFLCVGILLHRFGTVDEDALLGRGRSLRVTGVVFGVGGLALAGLPPFGTAIGKALLAEGSGARWWLPVIPATASLLTGAAVLRAAARIFLGWGPREPGQTPAERVEKREGRETAGPYRRVPVTMLLPAGSLLAASLAIGLAPGLVGGVRSAAHGFLDRERYMGTVLGRGTEALPEEPQDVPPHSLVPEAAIAAGAAFLAALSLFRDRLPAGSRTAAWRIGRPPLSALRNAHSGHVGDYVAWLVVGVAVLGITLAVGAL